MEIFWIVVNIIISLILMLGHWIIYMYSVPRVLHIFQLESYNWRDYIKWLSKNAKNAFMPGIRQLIACGGFYMAVNIINLIVLKTSPESLNVNVRLVEILAMFVVFFTTNILQIIRNKEAMKNAKKKLVYTARAKRLMVWNFLTIIMLDASFGIYALDYDGTLAYYSVLIALIPFNMIFANVLAYPTEQNINSFYINSAKRKLRKKEYRDLIRIGITGSYGKTSTKFILATILSEKFNVLATPESYNTTMGNVRVIREKLKPEHEVFISEMGARRRGDIAEICDFVRPQIGIITSIGPQHLETFKTIEKVALTKAELINSLDSNGVVFLPIDNEQCSKLYVNEKRKKYSYSLNNKVSDVYAKEIELNENGSTFIAATPIGDIKCTTKLLGEHNIENILGCIAIAIHLGLSKEQIEAGIRKVEPVAHRLQILNNGNGTIVIDDAFNSNPVGSKMALDVLAKFKGRKIVITPGMVELGAKEYTENKNFGRHMAKTVDIAILVGMKRSEPIVEGLREGKFNDQNVYVVPDLNAASKKLSEISQIGDVILFENDLPDNYNE